MDDRTRGKKKKKKYKRVSRMIYIRKEEKMEKSHL